MRTTLTIDDNIAARLKQQAYDSGKPFKQVVNEMLRAGLELKGTAANARSYQLQPASLGAPAYGIDLDKALQLAGELEDGELARKMQTRK